MEDVDVSWMKNTDLQRMLIPTTDEKSGTPLNTVDTTSDPDNAEGSDEDGGDADDDRHAEDDARRTGDLTLQWFYFQTFHTLYYIIWLFATFVAGFLDAFPGKYPEHFTVCY